MKPIQRAAASLFALFGALGLSGCVYERGSEWTSPVYRETVVVPQSGFGERVVYHEPILGERITPISSGFYAPRMNPTHGGWDRNGVFGGHWGDNVWGWNRLRTRGGSFDRDLGKTKWGEPDRQQHIW